MRSKPIKNQDLPPIKQQKATRDIAQHYPASQVHESPFVSEG